MPQALPAIGTFLAKNAIPLLLGGASIGTGMVSARKQKKSALAMAEQASIANEKTYNKYSLPSAAAVGAQATQNRGELGQARQGAYSNLTSSLAARGFGSGSGLAYKGAGDIESSYIKSLGQSMTELAKFQNTRQFGTPGALYQAPMNIPGATETGIAKGGNLLDTALGFMMMKNMLGGTGGGSSDSTDLYGYNLNKNLGYR